MEELDALIDQVEHLPPAPRILPELLTLLNQPDIDSSRVAQLLTFDPGLTVNVIRLCNSALLGGARPAEDLQEALDAAGLSPSVPIGGGHQWLARADAAATRLRAGTGRIVAALSDGRRGGAIDCPGSQ